MATSEPDVECPFRETSILVLTSSQSVVNKFDVLQVIRSVIRRQQLLLCHEDEYENFFASFAALSAHYIITNSIHIPKSQVSSAAQACKILLQYFLQKIQHISEECCLTQKQIFFIIYGLCTNSKTQVLSRSEVPVLTLVLKTAKDPPAFTIRSNDFQEEKKENHYRQDTRTLVSTQATNRTAPPGKKPNLKKAPGTAPSKRKYIPAPTARAYLLDELKNVYAAVVGLNQIREIRKPDIDGVTYNCFLCCSCISSSDIVDHISSRKHREKYLEDLKHPELETLRRCEMRDSAADSIIEEICSKVEAEKGRGKPEVYYDKNAVCKG